MLASGAEESSSKMRCHVWVFVVIWGSVCFASQCQAANFLDSSFFHVEPEATYEDVLRKWNETEKKLNNFLNEIISQILPMLIRSSSEVDVSPECSVNLLRMIIGIKEGKKWPLLMIDASGKIVSGILSGTSTAMGNYDQCVNIAEYDEYTKELLLQGKYCNLEVTLPLPKRIPFLTIYDVVPPMENFTSKNFLMKMMKANIRALYYVSMRTGICVPSPCQTEDLHNIAKYVADKIGLIGGVYHCEVKNKLEVDLVQIVVLSVLGVFALFCLIGTAIDIVTSLKNKNEETADRKRQTVLKKIFFCFSAKTNLERLMNTDTVREPRLAHMHGIRFLTMSWIVLGHTYVSGNINNADSASAVTAKIHVFPFVAVTNSLMIVDSFIFMSGFLLAYLSIQYIDGQGGKGFNIPILFIRRLWRLLPSTMIVIGCTMLIPMIGSGPVWHEMTDSWSRRCRTNWWYNLLFINDFQAIDEMCLPHTWYNAVDMQLFILGIVYLAILFRNKKFGMVFNSAMLILSVILTAAINYWKKLPPTSILVFDFPGDVNTIGNLTHFKPHVHVASYCVGLALGTYLARHNKTKMKRATYLLLWCAAITCSMATLFISYKWNQKGGFPDQAVSTFYSGTYRLFWSLGLAWIIFACYNGYGGFINSFLSWRGFVPLSRLTFLVYLWHLLVIFCYYGYWRVNIASDHLFAVYAYFGHLFVSFGIALIANLLYEAPLDQVEKLFFQVLAAKKKQEEKLKEEKVVTFVNGKESELHNPEVNGTYSIKL